MIAIIENGIVKNVIIATMAEARAAFPDATLIETESAGIGWAIGSDGVFVAPQAPLPKRRITRLAFRNRFTQSEKVAIEIAQLDNPTAPMPQRAQAAALRASQADLSVTQYVDLDRAETRGGVQMLEVAGLLAAGRALQILDSEVLEHEQYTG